MNEILTFYLVPLETRDSYAGIRGRALRWAHGETINGCVFLTESFAIWVVS